VENPLGNGQNVTTTYAYDDRWDKPTLVTAPGSAPVSMGYDSLGNGAWHQVGDLTRRTDFTSHASGPAAGAAGTATAPADNPLLPVNVNYVYGLADDKPQSWMHPHLYFLLVLTVLPVAVYAPTHLVLRRLFPSRTLSAAPISPVPG
jgi:hypothetical protein